MTSLTPIYTPAHRTCKNVGCDAPVVGRADKIFCSPKCKNAATNAKHNPKKQRTHDKVCKACGTHFTSTDSRVVTCSEKCKISLAKAATDLAYKYLQSKRKAYVFATSDAARQKVVEDILADRKSGPRKVVAKQALHLSKDIFSYRSLMDRPSDIKKPGKNWHKKKNLVCVKYDPDQGRLTAGVYFWTCKDAEIRCGRYMTETKASEFAETVNRILGYDDDRTVLFCRESIIEHNLAEATRYLNLLVHDVDVFAIANREIIERADIF
ncbi:MAG: hypothetical protein II336_05610 [Loktanella sp.]|nr:hypothetical protein [Loktanella sp.]